MNKYNIKSNTVDGRFGLTKPITVCNLNLLHTTTDVLKLANFTCLPTLHVTTLFTGQTTLIYCVAMLKQSQSDDLTHSPRVEHLLHTLGCLCQLQQAMCFIFNIFTALSMCIFTVILCSIHYT